MKPVISRSIPGALLYTQCNFFKRTLMQLISKHEGGPVDSSQDYEFTNWDAVAELADDFPSKL